jgi:glycosyltransferase involved in cell wall biosynthesis
VSSSAWGVGEGMRVLLGHDYYRSSAPSGEDAVFHTERALLERSGMEVIPFERFNDDIDDSTLGQRMRIALDAAWSGATYRAVRELIAKTRPDVAHFHNTFPVISPSAYAACQDEGVPVVQTLHNYRLICPGALLMRDGTPCEDCIGRSLLPALRHRCYRGSLPATAALVWMLASNRRRGSYHQLVNRYVALTRFAAAKLAQGGLPERRIVVKPNFLADVPAPGAGDGAYAVFVGRLSEEKGIHTLVRAWRQVRGLTLKVAGDGPLRGRLEARARADGAAVEFLGYRRREEVLALIGAAALQVVPSECYEGFPMAVLEAYACGTPVLASRIGSLDEIVKEGVTGVKFEAGNADELARKASDLFAAPQRLRAMRARARQTFEANYTAERNLALLRQIYAEAEEDFLASRGGR